MSVQADGSQELVLLARLWDRNTTGIEISLEAGLEKVSI
jgi:hypothetical protein